MEHYEVISNDSSNLSQAWFLKWLFHRNFMDLYQILFKMWPSITKACNEDIYQAREPAKGKRTCEFSGGK